MYPKLSLDYKSLLELLPPTSPQVTQIKRSLQLLEPRQQAAQKKEMAEMTGKLKNLGNSILGSLFLHLFRSIRLKSHRQATLDCPLTTSSLNRTGKEVTP